MRKAHSGMNQLWRRLIPHGVLLAIPCVAFIVTLRLARATNNELWSDNPSGSLTELMRLGLTPGLYAFLVGLLVGLVSACRRNWPLVATSVLVCIAGLVCREWFVVATF